MTRQVQKGMEAMSNKKTKSPLKAKPLRNPGQSLDEQIDKLLEDKISPWIFAIVSIAALTGLEWYRWYTHAPYAPIPYTVLAIAVGAIGFWKLRNFRRELLRLKAGRDGEKAVGQFLETLRLDGYRVFHDIIGEGFNIDHVIIGPTGVYSVETKTFSMPIGKAPKIQFDGKTITKNGFKLDRDPIIQAKAQGKWLSELLNVSSGRIVKVQPVVLFPGWFIDSGWQHDVWVLNPKGLRQFMEKRESIVSKEDIGLLSFHLSRYIRTN